MLNGPICRFAAKFQAGRAFWVPSSLAKPKAGGPVCTIYVIKESNSCQLPSAITFRVILGEDFTVGVLGVKGKVSGHEDAPFGHDKSQGVM